MPIRSHFTSLRALRGIDWIAIAFAIILSFACLARGAVDDAFIALLLLSLLPLLFIALRGDHTTHTELTRLGIILIAGVALVLLLQLLATVRHELLFDAAAWLRSIARLLWLVIAGIIALMIGASASSTRLFLLALLISSVACIGLTFFLTRSDMATATVMQPYRHGLVNANHAASYLGVALLLSIAHVTPLLKSPTSSGTKILLDFIDRLNLSVIIKWGFLLVSLLISLSGLLMTASRGGIFLSLLCSAGFLLVLLLKNTIHSVTRTVAITLLISMIAIWGFASYGQHLTAKLQTSGASDNARFDIMRAAITMISDHPWLGTGLGSFSGAFQAYRPTSISADGVIDKAHNSYLECAAEMGLPLLALFILVIGRIGFLLLCGVRDNNQSRAIPELGFAAWALAALHSLIDFPLQIPGVAGVFMAIVIVCASQSNTGTDPITQPAFAKRKRIRIRKRQHRD